MKKQIQQNNDNKKEITFQLMLPLHLEGKGEIDFTNLFVDGTKIEAQANRYSFIWKKSTNKYEERAAKVGV